MDLARKTSAARDAVVTQVKSGPKIALILGSGLAGLADVIEVESRMAYRDIPHFVTPTALGHPGNLIVGKLDGRPVIALQGRVHAYEGHSVETTTFSIRVLAEIGIHTLILSNAAGGINPRYEVGDLMIIRDHVNLMGGWTGPLAAAGRPAASRPSYIYDPQLIRLARQVSNRQNLAAHCGVYAAVRGPNYETRAEYRMLRAIGADAVGMSTVPESLLAVQLGMRVLGISIITNACSPDALGQTTGEAVVQAAGSAERSTIELVRNILAAGS